MFRSGTALLFCLGLCQLATPLHAFSRLGAPGAWNFWPKASIPVGYYVNLNLPGYTQATQIAVAKDAANAWSGPSGFSYSYQGTNTDENYYSPNATTTIMSIANGAPVGAPHVNGVPTGTPYWCFRQPDDSYVNGFSLAFSGVNGAITDSYVVICQNTFKWNPATLSWVAHPTNWYADQGVPGALQKDLWSIVTHELGHVLGLGHSSENINESNATLKNATMYYATSNGQAHQRDINADDIAGLQAIYGPSEMVLSCFEPDVICDPNTGICHLDLDCDGLSSSQEALSLTEPDDADTDDDDLEDGEEVNKYQTNPVDPDTDGDGLKDGEEVNDFDCDPKLVDTDGDGLSDPIEVQKGLHCWDGSDAAKDYDGDGLTNAQEIALGTLLNNADSDGDGIDDKQEIDNGLNPLDASDAEADPDGDGLSNLVEISIGTDIHKPDSDGDGLTDGFEQKTSLTNPLLADSDGDGLSDGQEVLTYNTDPKKSDTDGEGLTDGQEVNTYGTNPLVADTDGDGLSDSQEVLTYGTDPKKLDTDNDGLTDGQEILTYNTDPKKSDTDSDGLTDGVEVLTHNTDPLDPDSDDDDLKDGEEINTYGSNPLDKNTDDDCMDDGAEVAQGLSPTLYQVPSISLEPSSLDFQTVNRRRKMKYYVLKNTGNLPLTVQNAALSGSGFSMGQTPATVNPGEKAYIPVVFSPPGTGDYSGSVAFQTNDCFHTSASVSLAASGLVSYLNVSDDSLHFDSTPIWEKISQSITLANPDGNQPLKVTLTTNDPAFFPARLTDEVSPGETVQVPIYFRPYRYGNFEGKLTVRGFFGQDKQTMEVKLDGFGEGPAPEISVDEPSIDFGNVNVGQEDVREIKITNPGSGRLYIHRVGIDGFFRVFPASPAPQDAEILPFLERFTINPGGERILKVRFKPKKVGSVSGKLRISHNASPGSGSLTIDYQGQGD